jgi:hypothetical protein
VPFEITKYLRIFLHRNIVIKENVKVSRVFNEFSQEINVNKTILRFHLTPVILAIVKKTKITNDKDASG